MRRVLVVDDDDAALRVTRAHLESAGFDVVTRNDAFGTSAFILRDQPDAVVLDVEMPGLRGDLIAELLHKNAAERTPALILYSSLPEAELKAAAERCGAAAYVTKTGLIGTLVRTIDRCLGRSPSNRPFDESPPGAAGDVLDAGVIAGLTALESPKRPGFMEELVSAYVQEAKTQLRLLSETIARSDFEAAASAAHKIKGSSRNLGAKRLADECEDLEHLARVSNGDAAGAQLERVRQHFAEAERALRAVCAS